MPPRFEVILPLRNPTAVLQATITSLAGQTDREFSVLLSDNWSTNGLEFFEESEDRLRAAGLAVRRIRPPVELGRVEHWNWSHSQGEGEWIKPLFTGDWLAPEYIAATQAAIAAHPEVDLVNCSMASHFADGTEAPTIFPGGWRSPEQVLAAAFREGNCFGGPVNICYRKLAFTSVGGYAPALPVSADFGLILTLALRHGLVTCGPVLAHFNYHPTRFSTNFPYHRLDGDREQMAILLAANSQAAFAEIPLQPWYRSRYFWRLIKGALKARWKRFGRGAA